MEKLLTIEDLLIQKKAKLAEEEVKKQEVLGRYKVRAKDKPLSITDRIARIEEILGIE